MCVWWPRGRVHRALEPIQRATGKGNPVSPARSSGSCNRLCARSHRALILVRILDDIARRSPACRRKDDKRVSRAAYGPPVVTHRALSQRLGWGARRVVSRPVALSDRDELVLGLLAAPGWPTEVAGALAEDLPGLLA